MARPARPAVQPVRAPGAQVQARLAGLTVRAEQGSLAGAVRASHLAWCPCAGGGPFYLWWVPRPGVAPRYVVEPALRRWRFAVYTGLSDAVRQARALTCRGWLGVTVGDPGGTEWRVRADALHVVAPVLTPVVGLDARQWARYAAALGSFPGFVSVCDCCDRAAFAAVGDAVFAQKTLRARFGRLRLSRTRL